MKKTRIRKPKMLKPLGISFQEALIIAADPIVRASEATSPPNEPKRKKKGGK